MERVDRDEHTFVIARLIYAMSTAIQVPKDTNSHIPQKSEAWEQQCEFHQNSASVECRV